MSHASEQAGVWQVCSQTTTALLPATTPKFNVRPGPRILVLKRGNSSALPSPGSVASVIQDNMCIVFGNICV